VKAGNKNICKKTLLPTNGFGQVWLDKLISANCISGLQFWLDVQF
jgi:hypothetical protein